MRPDKADKKEAAEILEGVALNRFSFSGDPIVSLTKVLDITKPKNSAGRPHKLEGGRLKYGDDAKTARKTRMDVARIRGVLAVAYCQYTGIINDDEGGLLLDHGRATLPVIGRYSEMQDMASAVTRALDETKARQQKPRAGWDVYGTCERRKHRERVRDIISKE